MGNFLPVIMFSILFVTGFGCAERNEENYEKLISVNGINLFVKVVGEGEPIVILHGGPGFSHDYFLPHLYPLADEVKLVLFDQRGMGRSAVDLDSTSFSLDLLVEDIEALRKELKLGKIHLFAHSWGGVLAMRYAIRYPTELKSLILTNSVPASSEFTEATFAAFAKLNERQNATDLSPLRSKIDEGSKNIKVYERFTQLSFRPMFYDTARVNELKLNFSENYFKTQQLLRFLPPPTDSVNLLPDLKKVDVPVLIIRSDLEVIPVESDQKLKETFPHALLVNFSEAGHFPFIERRQAFTDSVLKFIEETE